MKKLTIIFSILLITSSAWAEVNLGNVTNICSRRSYYTIDEIKKAVKDKESRWVKDNQWVTILSLQYRGNPTLGKADQCYFDNDYHRLYKIDENIYELFKFLYKNDESGTICDDGTIVYFEN